VRRSLRRLRISATSAVISREIANFAIQAPKADSA
jgi:hypothetical protein